MRALVTGGNGFVGRHLVAALRQRGDEVIVAGGPRNGDDAQVLFDLSNSDNVREVVATARASLIFHLAAQSFVPQATQTPLETYDTNAMGTARVIEAVRAAGAPFSRVIVASSAEVYGPRERDEYPLDETLIPRPVTPYAASKLAAEAIARAAWRTYGIPIVITRGFNAIGPGQDARFVVAAFAAQLASVAAGETHRMLVGNLNAERDFLDVRDVAQAYLALAACGEAGEVYNVCSGTPVAIKELLRQLITIAHVAVEVREDPARMRPSDTPIAYGNAAKLQRVTGWTRQVPLVQSLRDAYDDAVRRRGKAKDCATA
ncbi:MAG: GDP-mannose 4,6-dehydratase [Candidatus Eremiobacteraeota bacterium]|nr:GDP-mannose 4,6-dehydratase [Candidatus Eremiobacteraeota bacterium]